MNEKELAELQDPESWEFEHAAEPRHRPRKARAVVSVAFPGEDFARVDRYAEDHGLTISELIRRATLLYVSGNATVATGEVFLMSAGGPAQMTAYFQNMTPATVAGSATFDALLT